MDDGYSLAFVSSSFARSAEFRARYGSLEDTDFVTLVYRNVLGREPDAEGLRHWVTMLADGRSRGWVMIGFSDSPEFKSRTGLIDTGDGPATLPERRPWSMLDGATSTEVLHHDPTRLPARVRVSDDGDTRCDLRPRRRPAGLPGMGGTALGGRLGRVGGVPGSERCDLRADRRRPTGTQRRQRTGRGGLDLVASL
jgi:hypothetical protein